MSTVGAKGQVVIDREIRSRLGIAPGWRAIQTLDGEKVEIRFIRPEHRLSTFGVLSSYAKAPDPTDEELDRAAAAGIAAEFENEDTGSKA